MGPFLTAAVAAALLAPTQPAGLFDGQVYTAAASRGSSIVVRNWRWPQHQRVTLASVPYADRVAVPPGRTAAQYGVRDADGIVGRPGCITQARIASVFPGDVVYVTLMPGRAYKISGDKRVTVWNSGPRCRG